MAELLAVGEGGGGAGWRASQLGGVLERNGCDGVKCD